MAHIFGWEHDSFAGTIGQGVLNWLGTGSVANGANQFVTPNGTGGTSDLPLDPEGEEILPNPNNQFGAACAQQCGPTQKKFVTTVCPDGRTFTKPYRTRKRKRRLASVSDIKDLAALKSVLGGGKAFESWIATRGR